MENTSGSSYNDGGERRSNPRPESTMALDFSSALDGAFNMDGGLLELGSTVVKKQQNVKSQSQELEELEARLRATEERLKKAGAQAPTSTGQQENKIPGPSASRAVEQPPQQRLPSRGIPGRTGALAAASVADRAPTPLDPSRSEGMPGAMPETPSDRQHARDYYDHRR